MNKETIFTDFMFNIFVSERKINESFRIKNASNFINDFYMTMVKQLQTQSLKLFQFI